jgi:hypothetical protein
MLAGCRAHAPTIVATAPRTTQEACQQIRDFFKTTYHATSDASQEMSAGCHMQISASNKASQPLDRHLAAHSWTRDPAYNWDTVPSIVAYATPSTRCSITKLVDPNAGNGTVSGGVGVGGGSYFSTGFGVGIGLGSSSDPRVIYKIDCLPRK